MHPVTLPGAAVVLREFRKEDLSEVLAIVGDPRVTDWLSFDTRTPEQADAMLAGILSRAAEAPRSEYYLAVALPHDDRLIGFARLALGGVQAGKVGYAIRADQWGHGYATDAVRTLIDFAFQQLGLHRISAAIGPDNTASITVVRKLGFTEEGRIRHHVHTNGAWRDSILYSVLADEWDRTRPIGGGVATEGQAETTPTGRRLTCQHAQVGG